MLLIVIDIFFTKIKTIYSYNEIRVMLVKTIQAY